MLNCTLSNKLTLDEVLLKTLDMIRNFTRFGQFYVNLGRKARAGTPARFDIPSS